MTKKEPSMARYTKLKIGDMAPDIQVVNADGETIDLSSIWADKPVVLTFLRHFG
jgi:peroxiredoxin